MGVLHSSTPFFFNMKRRGQKMEKWVISAKKADFMKSAGNSVWTRLLQGLSETETRSRTRRLTGISTERCQAFIPGSF